MDMLSIEILVFKTNIHQEEQLAKVDRILNKKGILHWNVDKHDIDKVLRIEAMDVGPEEVIHWLQIEGLECEELPD
jgi:hypothetical protein